MTLDPAVFKAYDIRGLYGEQIDEEGAERVGRAFIAVTARAAWRWDTTCACRRRASVQPSSGGRDRPVPM